MSFDGVTKTLFVVLFWCLSPSAQASCTTFGLDLADIKVCRIAEGYRLSLNNSRSHNIANSSQIVSAGEIGAEFRKLVFSVGGSEGNRYIEQMVSSLSRLKLKTTTSH